MSNIDTHDTDGAELVNIDTILSREFLMKHITDRDIETTVWMTIRALRPKLDASDTATARLAMEVARRIDTDGNECGVSLYNRLHSLLLDLRHEGRSLKCPMANATAANGQEADGCTS